MTTLCENGFRGMGCDNLNAYINCPDCDCDRTATEERTCVHCGNNELANEYFDSNEPNTIIDQPSHIIDKTCGGECEEKVCCEECKMNKSELELSDTMMKLFEERPERYLKVGGIPYPFIHGTNIIGDTRDHSYGYKMRQPDDYTMELSEYTGYDGAVKEVVTMKFVLNGDWVWRLSEVCGLGLVKYHEENLTCILKSDGITYAMGTLRTCLGKSKK